MEFLASKAADLQSDANDTAPGASIAAAFLQNFVEEGVEWIHLDVGGTCINVEENRGTGYGARLLLQLARELSKEKPL
jgi:leucyl aminopeptidase